MIIYRYRRPSDYLGNEILHKEIYFSPILTMNDFYDGFFRYSIEGDLERHIEIVLEQLTDHAKEILKRGKHKTEAQKRIERHSGKDSVEWAKNILNSPSYLEQSVRQLRIDFQQNPQKIIETVRVQNENARTMRQSISISCFSKKKLDMAMFAYYADEGKGVMLEYEDTKGITKEVNYLEELPEITIDKTLRESVEMQVFNKLDCWSHEEEIRAYVYNENPIRVDHGLIMKKVYLGPKIDSCFKSKVVQWTKEAKIEIVDPVANELGLISWD